MSSKVRWAVVIGSLLAVGALGTWGCCTPTCCEKKPSNQLILVSTRAPNVDYVSQEEVVISKMKNHQIVWLLPQSSTIKHIDIKLRVPQDLSEGPKWPPFQNCGGNQVVCTIACQDMVCRSGPVHPALSPGKKGTYYDYGFNRLDGQPSSDPGIRIDP